MTALEQAKELRQKAIDLLTSERQAIDEELAELGFDGAVKTRKPTTCKRCGQEGHTAKTCTMPEPPSA